MSSTNFYEVLDIDANASPEDIRRAYKKKALSTHPDRLPQGATGAEKETANERFRKVNNAYEILIDSRNRKLYDLYGVWPPPEELPDEPKQQRGNSSGYPSYRTYPPPGPFPDPFFSPSPFTRPFAYHRPPAFRDPFELFEAIFADMQRDYEDTPTPFNSNQLFNPYEHRASPAFNHPPASSNFPGFPPTINFFARAGSTDDNSHPRWRDAPRPNGVQTYSFQSSSRGQYAPVPDVQQPRWVSEGTMMQTVNGVTQTIHKKMDNMGNEHVTKIYPDGTEKYTVNGVQQSRSSGHIHGTPNIRRLPPANTYDFTPPFIPPEPDQAQGSSSKKRWWA